MHANKAGNANPRQDMLQELRRVEQDLQTIQARVKPLEERLGKYPPETATYQRGFEDMLALQAAQQDLITQVAFLEELLHSHLVD